MPPCTTTRSCCAGTLERSSSWAHFLKGWPHDTSKPPTTMDLRDWSLILGAGFVCVMRAEGCGKHGPQRGTLWHLFSSPTTQGHLCQRFKMSWLSFGGKGLGDGS